MAVANLIPYSFTLSYNDFIRGSNSFSELSDAGFFGLAGNPFYSPGLWGNAADATTPSSTLNNISNGIISWGKAKGALNLTAMAVGTNNSRDGFFYTVDKVSGALTQVGAADTAHDYSDFSDTTFYNGNFLTTSHDDITRNSLDLVTRVVNYWTAGLGQPALFTFNPHPQLVYANINYVADGQYLHKIDGGTATPGVLNLGADWIITALAEYQGLIYIAAEKYFNASGSDHGISKIVTWNSYSASFINEWSVDYRVSAMIPFGRLLIVYTKTMMGYWDGAEIKFLRRTNNQVFKYQVTECDYSLWYADRDRIIRWGYPLTSAGSTRRFYETFRPDNFTNNAVRAGSVVSFIYNTIIFTFVDQNNTKSFGIELNAPTSASTIERTYTLSERNFRQQIVIRGAIIETTALTANQKVVIGFKDQTGTERIIGTFDGANPGHVGRTRFVFDYFQLWPTRRLNPVIKITGSILIRSLQYVYELDESPINT